MPFFVNALSTEVIQTSIRRTSYYGASFWYHCLSFGHCAYLIIQYMPIPFEHCNLPTKTWIFFSIIGLIKVFPCWIGLMENHAWTKIWTFQKRRKRKIQLSGSEGESDGSQFHSKVWYWILMGEVCQPSGYFPPSSRIDGHLSRIQECSRNEDTDSYYRNFWILWLLCPPRSRDISCVPIPEVATRCSPWL